MDIFKLAELQIKREKKIDYTLSDIINRAIIIRKWLDHNKKTAKHILNGGLVCFSKGKIKMYKTKKSIGKIYSINKNRTRRLSLEKNFNILDEENKDLTLDSSELICYTYDRNKI